MGERLKFIVADDHPMVRQGVRMILDLEYPGAAFTEVDSFAAVRAAVRDSPRALLLVDLDMPGMEGADSLRALRQGNPELRIAVHTGTGDRQMVLDALDAGVNGYILKASPVEELLYAVATLLAGRIYVTAQFSRATSLVPARPPPVSAAAAVAPPPVPEPPQPAGGLVLPQPSGGLMLSGLTRREAEVLMCLLRGQSNKHIARALGIGEGTVKVHLANIFKSLGARNRTEAALIAAERGIVPKQG